MATNGGVGCRTAGGLSFGLRELTLGSADDTFNGVETTINVGGLEPFLHYPFWQREHVALFARIGDVHYFADVDPGGGNLFGDGAWDFGFGADFLRSPNWTLRLEARFLNGAKEAEAHWSRPGFATSSSSTQFR